MSELEQLVVRAVAQDRAEDLGQVGALGSVAVGAREVQRRLRLGWVRLRLAAAAFQLFLALFAVRCPGSSPLLPTGVRQTYVRFAHGRGGVQLGPRRALDAFSSSARRGSCRGRPSRWRGSAGGTFCACPQTSGRSWRRSS